MATFGGLVGWFPASGGRPPTYTLHRTAAAGRDLTVPALRPLSQQQREQAERLWSRRSGGEPLARTQERNDFIGNLVGPFHQNQVACLRHLH
jgi:hypothetical protein